MIKIKKMKGYDDFFGIVTDGEKWYSLYDTNFEGTEYKAIDFTKIIPPTEEEFKKIWAYRMEHRKHHWMPSEFQDTGWVRDGLYYTDAYSVPTYYATN